MCSNSVNHEAAVNEVMLVAGIPAIITFLLIPLAFVSPLIDSTRAPFFDLTQSFSQVAYWMSESGGKIGAPIVGVLMLVLLVSRVECTNSRRGREAGIVVLIVAVCAGGGAALNEHIVNAQLKIPRPNIIWLAGENGSGPLGMTSKAFYEIGDKATRGEVLSNVLNGKQAPVPMSPAIEAHWIAETGYSLPSGHSFSAMFFATFFLAIATTYVTTKRRWVFYALLPWALVVCYSRPILRLHTPADITIGALQGLLLGFLAWVVARMLLRRFASAQMV